MMRIHHAALINMKGALLLSVALTASCHTALAGVTFESRLLGADGKPLPRVQIWVTREPQSSERFSDAPLGAQAEMPVFLKGTQSS